MVIFWKAHSDVNQTEVDSCTPVMFAARGGDLEMVKQLLELKADPTKKDAWAETALHYLANSELGQQVLRAGTATSNLI